MVCVYVCMCVFVCMHVCLYAWFWNKKSYALHYFVWQLKKVQQNSFKMLPAVKNISWQQICVLSVLIIQSERRLEILKFNTDYAGEKNFV